MSHAHPLLSRQSMSLAAAQMMWCCLKVFKVLNGSLQCSHLTGILLTCIVTIACLLANMVIIIAGARRSGAESCNDGPGDATADSTVMVIHKWHSQRLARNCNRCAAAAAAAAAAPESCNDGPGDATADSTVTVMHEWHGFGGQPRD